MTDDYDLEELRAEARAEARFNRALINHPDPSDPDHPEYPEEDDYDD